MRVYALFGRFGVSFYCAECDTFLRSDEDGVVHPSTQGWLNKKPITCKYSGQIGAHPFRNMELTPSGRTRGGTKGDRG